MGLLIERLCARLVLAIFYIFPPSTPGERIVQFEARRFLSQGDGAA